MGDFILNTYSDGGRCKCHGGTFLAELLLDGSGDLAIETDEFAQFMQEIQVWFGTKPGERINPKLGCIIHDYQFDRTTAESLASLDLGLTRNFLENFPTFDNVDVRTYMYDDHTIYVRVRAGPYTIPLLADEDDIRRFGYAITGRIGKTEGPV